MSAQGDQMSAFTRVEEEMLQRKRELEAQAKATAAARQSGPEPMSPEYERVIGIIDAVTMGHDSQSPALEDAQRWLESADRYRAELNQKAHAMRQQLEAVVGESERVTAIRDHLRKAISDLHGYDVFAEAESTGEASR